jgi:2-keto-3-deoxy-6-phosphogluconate aldolase
MFRTAVLRLVAVFAVVASIGVTAAPASAELAQLSVVHGIPNLPEPVTVCVNGEEAFTFDYGEAVGPLELPAGTYDFAVKLMGKTVLSADGVELTAGVNYSAVAHLTPSMPLCEGDPGIQLSLFVNDVSSTANRKFRATVRHLADAPAVDVLLKRKWSNRSLTIEGLENPNEAVAEARKGSYRVKIFPAGGNEPVFKQNLGFLRAKQSYVVYAVGSICDGSFQLIIQSFDTSGMMDGDDDDDGDDDSDSDSDGDDDDDGGDNGGGEPQTAALSVVHGIQGLPAPVTVLVNGMEAFSFDFGEIVGPLALPEGEYDFAVVLEGDVVLQADNVLLMAGVNYSAVAHRTPSEPLCEGDAGINLSLFVNDTSATSPLDFRATVRHLADAPAVDIDLNRVALFPATIPIEGLANPNEVAAEAFLGWYNVDIFPAGSDMPVFSQDLGLLLPQTNYVVYAVGSVCDGSFTLLTQAFPTSN